MTDRPLTPDEINATFDAVENTRLAREERQLRREEAAAEAASHEPSRIADCPGVGEYGRGLTGKTVHWGCCPTSR